jgi:hypothetical protein
MAIGETRNRLEQARRSGKRRIEARERIRFRQNHVVFPFGRSARRLVRGLWRGIGQGKLNCAATGDTITVAASTIMRT